MIILEDLPLEERKKYLEQQAQRSVKRKEQAAIFSGKTGNYRYRCEQTVINKINGVISSHAETKREFEVSLTLVDYFPMVQTRMTSSHITVNPAQLNEVMELISEVDQIKCEATLKLNETTGKIVDILNLEEIKGNWSSHKSAMLAKHGFLTDPKAKESLETFFNLVEEPLKTKKAFIEELSSKIFFDLFFDQHLTQNELPSDTYSHTFHSYLFDQEPIHVVIEQTGISESEIRKSAVKGETAWKTEKAKDLYDQKYKAMVGYEFSDYDFTFRQHLLLDEVKMPKEIHTTIIEAIRNNIEIYVDYKLYQIQI